MVKYKNHESFACSWGSLTNQQVSVGLNSFADLSGLLAEQDASQNVSLLLMPFFILENDLPITLSLAYMDISQARTILPRRRDGVCGGPGSQHWHKTSR